jgi:hypothetical protein
MRAVSNHGIAVRVPPDLYDTNLGIDYDIKSAVNRQPMSRPLLAHMALRHPTLYQEKTMTTTMPNKIIKKCNKIDKADAMPASTPNAPSLTSRIIPLDDLTKKNKDNGTQTRYKNLTTNTFEESSKLSDK